MGGLIYEPDDVADMVIEDLGFIGFLGYVDPFQGMKRRSSKRKISKRKRSKKSRGGPGVVPVPVTPEWEKDFPSVQLSLINERLSYCLSDRWNVYPPPHKNFWKKWTKALNSLSSNKRLNLYISNGAKDENK